MTPFIMAWVTGIGLITYRSVKQQKAPPGPGQLILASGIFVMLALLSEAEKARALATLLAWGFDIAAFMNLFGSPPMGNGGQWPPGKLPDDVIFPGVGQPGGVTNADVPPPTGPSGGTNVPFTPN